jgi:hypothetical protein
MPAILSGERNTSSTPMLDDRHLPTYAAEAVFDPAGDSPGIAKKEPST